MSTPEKTKKPARKIPVRRMAAPRAKLIPPPGLTAAEFLKKLPPPSKDFDADFVEKVVACRSAR